MTHFGALCAPGPSHAMNLASIGRELRDRGHRFTLFSTPDMQTLAESQGISFQALDNSPGYVLSLDEVLKRWDGAGLSLRERFKYGIGEIAMYCEQAPQAMREAGIDALIGDQFVFVSRTVAERLGIPFVTVCNALPFRPDSEVSIASRPGGNKWPWWSRRRDRLLTRLGSLFAIPFARKLNGYRRKWGLPVHRALPDTFSPLAQITQLVREFDFPYEIPPANLYYVGPYRRDENQAAEFPYGRLDGRPLIYAAAGTQLGRMPGIWEMIAASCQSSGAQLVISLGGRGRAEDHKELPGNPLIVPFAPQRELLKRAALAITHGGLNSVMEALAEAVPMIAIPVSSDQPGVAARLVASGAGESIPFKQCQKEMLEPLVRRVLTDEKYKANALMLQRAIRKTGGAKEAADVIERVVAQFGPGPESVSKKPA